MKEPAIGSCGRVERYSGLIAGTWWVEPEEEDTPEADEPPSPESTTEGARHG